MNFDLSNILQSGSAEQIAKSVKRAIANAVADTVRNAVLSLLGQTGS